MFIAAGRGWGEISLQGLLELAELTRTLLLSPSQTIATCKRNMWQHCCARLAALLRRVATC